MLGSKIQIIFLSSLCAVFAGIILFELGIIRSNEYHKKMINDLNDTHIEKLRQIDMTIIEHKKSIYDKESRIQALVGNKDELANQVFELNAQVAGLSVDENNPYPFTVPSTGIVGSKVSTYLDNYKGAIHYGIDIWTSTQNGGAISTHKGNPVYSACSGVVESFQLGNGGVTIKCDTIPKSINVPAHKVYTYYGHMANAITNEQFIYLKIGQRVQRGQFIGYQGDLSMFTPGMRNVHLHFSVFSGFRESEGTQDPCKYIGGSCREVGKFFVSEFK